VPQTELLKAKIEGINAKIEEAKSDEEQAELSLSYAMIKAPFDGTINRIPFKVGSFINEGTLLTTISNTSEVFAYFNVAEKDYLEYATSNKKTNSDQVLLVLANGRIYKHEGQIEIIENEFDKNTGTIAFRARFPNPEKLLKHGASGKVLVKTILKNVMLIPQKSTFEVQENIYVYTLDDSNIVRMQKVNPLYRLSNYFITSSDLSPNSKFVLEGIQYLKSGDKISLETTLTNKTANK
jgi:membrane fusion protein (multidrug efflux system)